MHMTSLHCFIFICLCYSVLRMPTKEQRKDMTSQILSMTEKHDNETFEENETTFKTHLKKDCVVAESPVQTISIDFCFIFLYYISSRKISTQSILASTAMFFWRVSAFPVNCTERKKETGLRKSRNVSTNTEFITGDCEKAWFQFEEKCYKVIEEIKNYKTASAHCTSLESELVKIQTKDQNDFVKRLANKSGYLWTAVQKTCRNCTETVGGYMKWLPRQLSDVSKCVAMNSLGCGQWKDFDCEYMFVFVCEKALSETYTEKQLLIALLVPIFSCLTLAISFTTALLVSSVRRVGQPFKLASRYARTKQRRKTTTWDVVDILREASLQGRNGSRLKPPLSNTPSIEITKPGECNGTILSKDTDVKTPWYKRSNQTKNLDVRDERRRSSNTSSSGNSSLYELLARLNKMGLEPQNETTDDGIQLEEITENGLKPGRHIEGNIEAVETAGYGETSFQNMAFRDSIVSVETNGLAWVTSVQQVNQRDSIGITGDIQDITSEAGEYQQSSCDEDDREETGTGNTQTVRADVHIANNECVLDSNENIEKHERRPPLKGKVVWTYSL